MRSAVDLSDKEALGVYLLLLERPAALDAAGEGQKGVASSLVVMMRMTGMIIGLSAITAWGMDRFHLMTAGLTLPEIMESPQELTDSLLVLFNNFFLASFIICLAAVLPALWLGKRERRD